MMNKVERMMLGGLPKFSVEYMTFCIKTFPTLTKTTTRPNGLMKQTLGIFSATQTVVMKACGYVCGVWRLSEKLSTGLGRFVTICVSPLL